jgi:hypothetical protein
VSELLKILQTVKTTILFIFCSKSLDKSEIRCYDSNRHLLFLGNLPEKYAKGVVL